ncbi:MAG: SDR family oxidoreductase [Candidatus Eisenbacteria bacterium]|nr:SDR family oxidoreductase [Candidatus Eisenbacteria bacterium]
MKETIVPSPILIYGGSGGIGSAAARSLHARGFDLHLAGRNEEKLHALADELGTRFTVGDVTDAEFPARVAKEAGESLAGLVYAVGTINLGSFRRLSEPDYLQDFRVNALGAALAVKAALPALKRHDGTAAVVLFSSVAATQGFTMHASVGMAKGAVAGLTLALAAELAPQVRVNAIAPSLTKTPLTERLLRNEKAAAALAELHALPRLGSPEEIAALAAFLVSPDADWITGQIIGVDGGRASLRTRG